MIRSCGFCSDTRLGSTENFSSLWILQPRNSHQSFIARGASPAWRRPTATWARTDESHSTPESGSLERPKASQRCRIAGRANDAIWKIYDGAISVLGRAERIEPATRPELLLALSFQHLKKFDEANHYLEMAKQRDPNNPEVSKIAGGLLSRDRNYPRCYSCS